jgi:hypothetical protein
MHDTFEIVDGFAHYRPRGSFSLVAAVDLVSAAIARCRDQRIDKLLINVTDLEDVPIPTLVDRFLMVEDWANASQRLVTVVMVASPEYIHPHKFGVKVAAHFGLVVEAFTTEDEGRAWLRGQVKGA